MIYLILLISLFFFFNDTATTEIYTLSLHDALPILWNLLPHGQLDLCRADYRARSHGSGAEASRQSHQRFLDRKSTRLNSSHSQISYAVFCLKKKKHKGSPTPKHHDRHDRTLRLTHT